MATENKKLATGQATSLPIGVVAVWALQHFVGTPIPPEVACAIGSLVAGVAHRFAHLIFHRSKHHEL